MSRSSIPTTLLLAAAAVLAACEFAPPATPAAPGATDASARPAGAPAPGVELGQAEPSAPAGIPTYAAFRAPTAPDVTVHPIQLKSVPKPGGATWADLDRDDDARDDFDPDVPVIFQAPGYPAATEPNGKASVRGKSTRRSDQKSYRIELKKDAPAWRGLQDVLLNKHPYDRSRLRNRFAFDAFEGIPEMVGPKVGFATLEADGKPLGFFTQIERMDKRFLKAHGLDDQGHLYQAEFFEFQRYPEALKATTAAGYDEAAFEKHLEIMGAKDHTKLLAMLDAVNDPAVPINTTIDKHFDRANYVTWLALAVVTDNLDTNSQNFFLYSPAGEGPWRFLPWDYDGALGYYDQDGRKRVTRWQEGPANWWGVTLHRRFMKDPENVRQLVARIDELADGFFTRARVEGYLNAYRPIVGEALKKAPDADEYRSQGDDPVSTWQANVDMIPTVFGASRDRFKAALKRPMPIFVATPRPAEGGLRFRWDPSHDLQGDAITYDLIVARDPGMKDVVAEKKGLTATEAILPVPAGTYFQTVIIRDATGEWQTPFGKYTDEGTKALYAGVEKFTAP